MEQLLLWLSDPTVLGGVGVGLAVLVGGGFWARFQQKKGNGAHRPQNQQDTTPNGEPTKNAESEPTSADFGAPSGTGAAPSGTQSATETRESSNRSTLSKPEQQHTPELENADSASAIPETPDIPEEPTRRMRRLRSRLARSGALGNALLTILGKGTLAAADWEEIEDTLLMADLGVEATEQIVAELKTAVAADGTTDLARVKQILRAALLAQVDPNLDRSLNLDGEDANPGVVLVVGVNGTGKTTTVGKIARILVASGKTVTLGAADTFRAGAADQLETWAQRVGATCVRSHKEGADPASVAFDAVAAAKQAGSDTVLVDTAGRLQNKTGLMDELGKVRRVIEKQAPITETLLVLDATIGQNSMAQAKVFNEVVPLTGIVLTKLDGSAKGGIVVSVQKQLGVPVKLVGLGEGPDDLAPFDAEAFVDAIVAD